VRMKGIDDGGGVEEGVQGVQGAGGIGRAWDGPRPCR